MAESLHTIADLATIVLGFGLIIAIHEAGHFVAARWAGIRVLAFAIGFGRPLFSYRKGMGFRAGSSEVEYRKLQERAVGPAGEGRENARAALSAMSPTEYRLNVIPVGGYVKMLGQDDADPTAKSDAPDSYQNCPPAKRMVVISAGVVANLITAALLFVIVFSVGLKAEAPVIGAVNPSGPAARPVAINGASLGVTDPGLKAGDTIVWLGQEGNDPRQFNEVFMTFAMSARQSPTKVGVHRPGVDGTLVFEVTPEADDGVRGLLSAGIAPATDDVVMDPRDAAARAALLTTLSQAGLEGVEPGMRLVSVNGLRRESPPLVYAEREIAERGEPVTLVFENDAGDRVERTLDPEASLELARLQLPDSVPERLRGMVTAQHLLGLTPVMRVAQTNPAGAKAGLLDGDVFVRLGERAWPSVPEGMSAIRASAGRAIRIVVLRGGEQVDLGEAPVGPDGTIGFNADSTAGVSALITRWPDLATAPAKEGDPFEGPSAGVLELAPLPGTRIVEAAGRPVESLRQLRELLRSVIPDAETGAEVSLVLELPLEGAPRETRTLRLSRSDVERLQGLGWDDPLPGQAFETLMTVVKGDGPGEAVLMGLHETRRLLERTYLTLTRLFQGTIGVQHLNGPVGIAHTGTIIARRGFIWVLFFMGLVSVNLAVVNFLPIPITDGGHMLFLLYEQITGKAPSDKVLNFATLAGLGLIVCVFLVVTFNDLRNLLGL